MRGEFGPLLRQERLAAGWSQAALARAVGVNSGYISRLEAGARAAPGPAVVRAIGEALGLPAARAERLLAAAGYLPPSLAPLASADPTLALVLRLLTDPAIPEPDRREFREIIRLVARRWVPDA